MTSWCAPLGIRSAAIEKRSAAAGANTRQKAGSLGEGLMRGKRCRSRVQRWPAGFHPVPAAVNHDGDSDSTGAMAGNCGRPHGVDNAGRWLSAASRTAIAAIARPGDLAGLPIGEFVPKRGGYVRKMR